MLLAGVPAWADDPCAGRVTASLLSHDRGLREGLGLLVNQCGRPVQAEILVVAHNRDGYPVARMLSHVQADAAPLSVLRISLPFVQSVVVLSGYTTEIAAVETIDPGVRQTARTPADVVTVPGL